MQQSIKIGTRGSPLALAQANEVKRRLIEGNSALSQDSVEIIVIKTSGDKILDRHLMYAGGKGLFTKEIEDALLSGTIDCAVHSTKDMPTQLPDGLMLSTFLPREDVRDAFISPIAPSFAEMPKAAVLGTASLRRRAQALRLRPDLKVVTFRGNVQTRLKKLASGEAAATFLALAGLNRLSMQESATEILSPKDFMPAPAQGAVTVEIREGNTRMAEYLRPLHSEETELAITAERAFLASLDGSCRTPLAALCEVVDNQLMLQAELLSLDGQIHFSFDGVSSATLDNAVKLGKDAGQAIRKEAGQGFFDQLASEVEATIS